MSLPGGREGRVVGVGGKDSDGKPRVRVETPAGEREVAGRLVEKKTTTPTPGGGGDSDGGDGADAGPGPDVDAAQVPASQAAQVARGRAAIAAAHKDAGLPRMRVGDSSGAHGEGWGAFDGYYSPGPAPGGSGYGTPRGIALSPDSQSRGNIFIHEYGHALDFESFGDGASVFASPPRNRLGAAVVQLVGEAGRSRSVRKAVANLPTAASRGYWRSPEELWARAYAQWVAEKSGDRVLVAEVARMRDAASGPKGVPIVWSDDDWPPVRDAVERVLSAGGLLE